MVDPGEDISATLKREFGEEALSCLELSAEDQEKIKKFVHNLFEHGEKVGLVQSI